MNKRKVPKIRFKGFYDDWEQRKLKVLSDFITKGATPTTYGFEWQSSGIPFFRNDAIKDNQFVYGDYSYISEEANESLKRSEIHADDILIAITGEIGKVGIIPKNVIKGNINQHTARVRVVKEAIPYFVYQSLATENQQRKYQLIKTGLSMPQLSLEQIRETVVSCPSMGEQYKIGSYFQSLDHLITLHQRKLEKLKIIKKSMLENCFPKNGEKVPKIRFSGFSDDWEQRKFKDLFVEKREKTATENEDELLSCAITGMYLNSELFSHFRGSSNIGYIKVKKNDLILSAQNLHLGNANVNLRFEHGIISPAYKVYELNECEPNFVQAWIKKDKTKDFFLAATTEGASQCRKNIDWNTLGEQLIAIPSIDEQIAVGKFFISLNRLITLHQSKLEKLKMIKKSMLETMFV